MAFRFWFGASGNEAKDRGEENSLWSGRRKGDSDTAVPLRAADERILRLNKNDEDAFASIFREYVSGLLTFAWRKVESRSIAEEIVQDVFFDLWERRAELDPQMLLRAYLYQAVRYRVQNQYRSNDIERRYRERINQDISPHEAGRSADQADDNLSEMELKDAISAAINRIPPRSREVFLLSRESNLSYMEIAETLGIAVKTVEVHMGRALAVLRKQLQEWTK